MCTLMYIELGVMPVKWLLFYIICIIYIFRERDREK